MLCGSFVEQTPACKMLMSVWSTVTTDWFSVYRENFAPILFLPFKTRANFQTGLIELYIKDYKRKLENWRIQDWANQFQISIGRK